MTTRDGRPATGARRWVDGHGNELDETDRGLVYDLQTLVDRRRVLGLFGGVGAAALLAACGGSAATGRSAANGTASASSTTASASGSGELTEVPEETAGPYPGDGSNGPNVLDDSGIVRSDIRSSFGASTTTAEGVPLVIRLTVRDAATGDVAKGAGVYLCYAGRWPHIHFEVYASLADATGSGPIVTTSQIALPKEACEAVYATAGYEQSVANLSQVSLHGDNVFGDDGGIHQLASMSGDAASGYLAALTIGV